MSFQDLEVGRSRRVGIANGKQDPTHEVVSAVFEMNTLVSTFQRLVNTLATPKDTPELREKLHKTRLHIEQMVKDTSAKLKQASETDHHAEISASKKITDAKLAKDFQAVLKEFQKAQRLSAERETAYSSFAPQAVPPSSYAENEIDERSDKHPEQRALLVESRRFQGLSPENLPLSNGRRSHWRTCKEDDGIIANNKEIDDENDATKTIPNGSGGSGDMLLQWGHRKRSRISRSVENRSAGAPTGGSGLADDSSSSSSTQLQAMMKVPRRSITLPAPATTSAGLIETKNSSTSNIMPPPSSILPDKISITTSAPTNSSTSNGKVGSHKSSSKDNSSFMNRRNLEDRSGGGSGSHPPRSSSSKGVIAAAASSSRSKLVKRSPQKILEKNDQKKIASHTTTSAAPAAVCSSGPASLKSDEKINGLVHQEQVVGFGMNHHQNNIGSALPQEAGCSNIPTNNHEDIIGSTKIVAGAVPAVAMNGGREVHEWPRVHIPLSRKEKEEDFLLMKGTKLPHRPKKRPKAVDRMLQYCFPGTWLADVTKARYEVKEKKCTTKKPKRRGLKGMESMESDSE